MISEVQLTSFQFQGFNLLRKVLLSQFAGPLEVSGQLKPVLPDQHCGFEFRPDKAQRRLYRTIIGVLSRK